MPKTDGPIISSPSALGETIFVLTPSSFHRRWHDFFVSNDRAVLWSPPNHGATTQITILGSLYQMGNNRGARGLICSFTHAQATKWVQQIKTNVRHNDYLRMIYPNLQQDCSLEAVGFLGSLVSGRYDFVVIDGALAPENTSTRAMREKTIEWFLDTIAARVVPDGKIWVIEQTWHEDDLAHFLAWGDGAIYASRKIRAGEGRCRWPERFGDYDKYLDDKREEIGEVEFNRQYLQMERTG